MTIKSSAADEQKLTEMLAAVDRLFDRCADTVRHTDVSVRRWLRSSLPNRPYKFPFELVTTARTEKIYRAEMKRFLCFWLRLSRLPRGNVVTIAGRALGEQQALALNEIWSDDIWESKVTNEAPHGRHGEVCCDGQARRYHSHDEVTEEEEEAFEENEGYEDDENDDDNGEQEEADVEERTDEAVSSMPNCDPAADLILRLFYYAATEEFEDSRSSSSLLVYFSAIRGLSPPDGAEFLRPHRFTPVLSRLIYCTRLICLEATLPRFPHAYVGIAARPTRGHLTKLNHIRTEKMCDGAMSPLGEFVSLLAYGRTHYRSEGPAFCFEWSDDGQEIAWDGNSRLTMDEFRRIVHKVLERATDSCRRLMFDWVPPDPDIRNIRDRLLDSSPRCYSKAI